MAWKDVEDTRRYMRLYQRDLRAERKKLGICTGCGKEKAFSPYVRCPACIEKFTLKNAAYASQLDAVRKQRIRASQKLSAQKIFIRRREQGLCPKCGKKKPAVGRKFCERCLLKMREYIAAYRQRKRS